MTLDDLVPFEERRKIADKLLNNPETKLLMDKIIKRRINPGFIVSFDYFKENITGIVKSICFEIEKQDLVTCAKIIRFEEWGFMPEKQTPEIYRLEDMKNYNIISDGRSKE
jgi:hypothetical protein